MTHVYLVIPWGITAHSPAAVCATRDEAAQIAADLWKQSDGYHSFTIECRRLGKTYNTFSLGLSYRNSKPTTKPPMIEHVSERDVESHY